MRPIHVVAYDEPGAIIKHSVIGLPEEMPDTNSQVAREQRRTGRARQGLLRGTGHRNGLGCHFFKECMPLSLWLRS